VKQSLLGFDGHGVDIDPELAGDQVGDLVDHAYIVEADDLKPCQEGDLLIFHPFGLHHAVAEIGHEFGGIGAIGAMDGKPLARGHKTKYIVAGDRFTAIGKIVHNAFAALSENDQLRVLSCGRRFRFLFWGGASVFCSGATIFRGLGASILSPSS